MKSLHRDTSLLAIRRAMQPRSAETFWACAAVGRSRHGFQIYPLVIGNLIARWKVDPEPQHCRHGDAAASPWRMAGVAISRSHWSRQTLQITILGFSSSRWPVHSCRISIIAGRPRALGPRLRLRMGRGGVLRMGEAIRPQYRVAAVGSCSRWAVAGGSRCCRRPSCSLICRRDRLELASRSARCLRCGVYMRRSSPSRNIEPQPGFQEGSSPAIVRRCGTIFYAP